jgi:tRNA A-37 threonylcarbamoyl transferase component Bud32/tetratricopeptide (TPR) repeat protein
MLLTLERLQAALGAGYRVERELGGGGMSRVFAAEEVALGRRVALKVLPPELAGDLSLERFRRELLTVARLQQANIVPVHSAGEVDGLPWFSMPFIEGRSLRERLAEAGGPLPIAEAVNIARDVARALAYAHARGVVHRDVKPENILLSAGTAVVTDFGIAKALDAARTRGDGTGGTTQLTQAGLVIGTPLYMAPEQAAGEGGADGRADLYALGCVLFELLTGRPPFTATTAQKLLVAHMTEPAPDVRSLRPEVSDRLATVLRGLLAKEAADRPAGAAAVVAALDAALTTGSQPAPVAELRTRDAVLRWSLAGATIIGATAIADRVIGLPEWGVPGAVALAVAGLPAVLATGYVRRTARRATASTPPSGTLAGLAVQAAPHLSWRRTARLGAIASGAFAVGIATFLGLRAAGIGPEGSLRAAGKLDEAAMLVVADFAATAADSSLGRVATEAVRTSLAEASTVSLLGAADAAAALQRMERPPTTPLTLAVAREVAEREGAAAVVAGDLTQAGAGWIVALRLVTPAGDELAAYRATASDTDGLLRAIESVTRKLRGRMGESLVRVRETAALERVTTRSLEAFRRFAEGARAVDVERDNDRGVRLLREAVQLDTSFAMAWRKLGVAYGNGGFPRALRDSAYARAFAFRDRLPEFERLRSEGSYYLSVVDDRRRAEQAYREMQQRFPQEFRRFGTVNLMNVLHGERRFAAAESIGRLIPEGIVQRYANLHSVLLAQGKFAAAESLVQQGEARLGPATLFTKLRADAAWLRGDWDGADREAERLQAAATRAADRTEALYILEGDRFMRGRFREAQAARRELLQLTSQRGVQGPTPLVDSITTAFVDVRYRGRPAEALRRITSPWFRQQFAAAAPDQRPYAATALVLSAAGRPDDAARLLDDAERLRTDEQARRAFRQLLLLGRGRVALARNEPRAALTLADSAALRWDGLPWACLACVNVLRAQALDQLGQADSVSVLLDAYLDRPDIFRLEFEEGDYTQLPWVLKRSGELHEQAGRVDRAIARYESLVTLWKNADPELQPTVADLRGRIARLKDRLPR